MKKLFVAAALTATAMSAPVLADTPRADADPAMWVVRDADTTVYLFGTAHLLDGSQDWFNDEVKTAFDASSELVIEAIIPEQSVVQAKIGELAVYKDGSTLSQRLTPELKEKLGRYLASAGAPPTALDPLEPWFAAMALLSVATQKLALKPEYGPESILVEAAKGRKVPVGELEGFDAQLDMFDRLPEAQQVKFLASGITDAETMESSLKQLNETWAKGDVEAFADLSSKGMKEHPELDKMMFADRNARWAEWIKARMDKPGTVFMAVGAGHLAGPGSVQLMLERHGFKTTRVKN